MITGLETAAELTWLGLPYAHCALRDEELRAAHRRKVAERWLRSVRRGGDAAAYLQQQVPGEGC